VLPSVYACSTVICLLRKVAYGIWSRSLL
jgi:hypothetical protein